MPLRCSPSQAIKVEPLPVAHALQPAAAAFVGWRTLAASCALATAVATAAAAVSPLPLPLPPNTLSVVFRVREVPADTSDATTTAAPSDASSSRDQQQQHSSPRVAVLGSPQVSESANAGVERHPLCACSVLCFCRQGCAAEQARSMHSLSPIAASPWTSVFCAVLPCVDYPHASSCIAVPPVLLCRTHNNRCLLVCRQRWATCTLVRWRESRCRHTSWSRLWPATWVRWGVWWGGVFVSLPLE